MKNFSKILMISSAIMNGILGLLFSFLPQETGRWMGATIQGTPEELIAQLLGAALIGIAITNYMSRGAVLGGIYGKPIQLGNLVFHLAAGLSLLKFTVKTGNWLLFGIPALFYLLLTAAFIRLNFTSAV